MGSAGPSVVDRLLDDDLGRDPVTGEGLSNHLPMALIALHRLGADDERLRRFAARYRTRLVPVRSPTGPVPPGERPPLGIGRHLGDLLAHYRGAIAADGVDPVLRRDLPGLMPGLGGAAFHGLIRLGYALDRGREVDVAAGLAYLADVTQRVPVPGPGGDLTAAGLIAAVGETMGAGARRGAGEGFSSAFARVAADPRFVAAADRVAVGTVGLDAVARLTHGLYAGTRDFFALHTLTATHATRLVLDRMDESDRPAAVAALAVAVTAAWVVVGAPAFAPMPEAGAGGGTDVAAADVPSWERIAAEAVADDDEHVIKVVYSCREEARARADERYRTTAAAAVPGARAGAADP